MESASRVAAVLMAVCCMAGCAHVRNGIHNTIADSTDIFRADVSASFGTDMGAHAMATQFLQLKFYSYEDLYRVGFGMRHVGVWEEEREDWWVGTIHARNMHIRSKSVRVIAPTLPAKLLARTEAPFGLVGESRDEFGIGLHLFVAGFRVGVRPLEFLDFLLSPFSLDPCDDNMTWQQRRALHLMKHRAKEAAPRGAKNGE